MVFNQIKIVDLFVSYCDIKFSTTFYNRARDTGSIFLRKKIINILERAYSVDLFKDKMVGIVRAVL